jgi:hypothetical protein
MKPRNPAPLTSPPPQTIYALAAAAECDPRSIVKALRGEPVRAIVRTRIVRALAAAGLRHLLADKAAS